MNDLDEIWAYDDPHESGGNVHITMTKQQAIEWTKKCFQKQYPQYKYMNDEELLFNEFVVINCAYKEKEKDNAEVKSGI